MNIIHRTIGENGTLWQPSVDILNSVIINCSFSDHRVVVLLSICLISTTQNEKLPRKLDIEGII